MLERLFSQLSRVQNIIKQFHLTAKILNKTKQCKWGREWRIGKEIAEGLNDILYKTIQSKNKTIQTNSKNSLKNRAIGMETEEQLAKATEQYRKRFYLIKFQLYDHREYTLTADCCLLGGVFRRLCSNECKRDHATMQYSAALSPLLPLSHAHSKS